MHLILLIAALALSASPVRSETRILVVYDSRTGNTEALARAVFEGVQSVEAIAGTLRRAKDASDEEILSAAGILVGSPVHWASLSPETKSFLERVGDVLVGAKQLGPGSDSTPRAAGAFVTGGAASSGNELARITILAAFLNMRFVVIGGEAADGFGTLGAQATTGETDPGVSEEERAEARRFGARFASLARLLDR